jgi:hypothetical protein
MRPPPSSHQTQEANIGAVGNVTGSKEWQESGKKDAQEGINEMKVSPIIFSLHRFGELYGTGPGIVLMALRIGSECSEDLRAGCQWTRWKG